MHLSLGRARSALMVGPAEAIAPHTPAHALESHYDESRNATAMDPDPEWAVLAKGSLSAMRSLEERPGWRSCMRSAAFA